MAHANTHTASTIEAPVRRPRTRIAPQPIASSTPAMATDAPEKPTPVNKSVRKMVNQASNNLPNTPTQKQRTSTAPKADPKALSSKSVASVTPTVTMSTPTQVPAATKRERGRPTNEELGRGEPVYMAKMRRRAEKRNMSLDDYMAERKANRKAATTQVDAPKAASKAVVKSVNATAPILTTKAGKAVVASSAAPQVKARAKAAPAPTGASPKSVSPPEVEAREQISEVVQDVRIKHTNKLDKFTFHPANRKVVDARLRALTEEISKNNLLHLNPIIVDKLNRIVNGQHRYLAAKALGLTIYYVQGDVTAKEMLDLNANQKSLVLKDYLDSYIAQGYGEYIKVAEVIKKYKIQLYNAIGLLSGRNSQPNSDLVNLFKDGQFKVRDLQHTEYVLSIRNKMEGFAPDFYQQKNFTNAVAKFVSRPGFDEGHFLTRLEKNGYGQLQQAVSTDLYDKQMLDIYNYKTRKDKRLVLE